MKKIAFIIMMSVLCMNIDAQTDLPFIPENNYHPSFTGCRITPDSIKFYPQNPTDVISFVYKTKRSPNDVFNSAKQWVAKTFKEYKNVVQMEDINSHIIVLKGNIRQKQYSNTKSYYNTILYFTSTIECKENKFRIKMEDFSVEEKGDVLGYPTSRIMTFREMHELINGTLVKSNEYKKFLKHVIEDSKENVAVLFNSLSSAMDTVDDF